MKNLASSKLFQLVGVLALVVIAYFVGAQGASSPAPTPEAPKLQATPDELKDAVTQALKEDPGIIIAAFEAMSRQRNAQAQKSRDEILAPFLAGLEKANNLPVMGNPQGDVTIVEFFDYQCGYCKQAFESLMTVVEQDSNLRVIFYEYPILGEDSRLASEYALAALKQDKYIPLHTALMRHRGRLSEEVILKLASDNGLDVERLKTDRADPTLGEILDEHIEVAQKMNITGTPAFIIGQELIPGAINPERMRDAIARARKVD